MYPVNLNFVFFFFFFLWQLHAFFANCGSWYINVVRKMFNEYTLTKLVSQRIITSLVYTEIRTLNSDERSIFVATDSTAWGYRRIHLRAMHAAFSLYIWNYPPFVSRDSVHVLRVMHRACFVHGLCLICLSENSFNTPIAKSTLSTLLFLIKNYWSSSNYIWRACCYWAI